MMQAWPHMGLTLKRILNNPEERDALLRSFAADLDHVPELPTYTDPALARAALAGFQTGYQAGIDAAHRRAWLVTVHTNAYYLTLAKLLKDAKSKQEVIKTLEDIASKLERGGL
jgi:hypothetical protein